MLSLSDGPNANHHQFGFRHKHGTQHALNYLDEISIPVDNVNNEPTVASALNLEKPFEFVC